MTSEDIINGLCGLILKDRTSNKVFPNVYFSGFEADVLELTKSGYSYEYEVKVSRSDFKNDRNKNRGWSIINGVKQVHTKYEDITKGGRVNYFYYIVPDGMLTVEDIPEFAGLMYAELRDVRYYSELRGYYDKPKLFLKTIKQAPKLSKEKFSEKRLFKCLESTYYRFHKLRNNQLKEMI